MPNQRPQPEECAPYYHLYIQQVEGNNILNSLSNQKEQTLEFLRGLEPPVWSHRYASDKWTVKELMLHVIDTERIFAYRALRIARNDQTPIEGFEQDDYVPFSGADARNPTSIIEEYAAVREASLQLFRQFSPEMWSRQGIASSRPFTARSLAYITAGHELHHLRILREKYLK